MKSIRLGMAVVAMLAVLCAPAQATITWGYENFVDESPVDGVLDEWGGGNSYNLDLTAIVDDAGTPGDTSDDQYLGVGVIGTENPDWGKTWYGTGVSSDDIISTYRYLYVETYDVQGNMKVWMGTDADHIDATQNAIYGDTGDPNVIYNPGAYVFDLAGWTPAASHDNTTIQLLAEGGSGAGGFTVNRVFLTDDIGDTGFSAIPEPATLGFLTMGLATIMMIRRKRRS